ncbi:MAG: ABC-F family ATP-binding cassette domain-containing protein [bacterium]
MSKLFGDRILFEEVSMQINRGDRAALVGPNGAGKSTLFSLLLGTDSPNTGNLMMERGATIGHLPQETAPVAEETVLELATATTPRVAELQRRIKAFNAGHDTESHDFYEVQAEFDAIGGYKFEAMAKTILHGLAFRDADFDRPLKTMSGGWVMRAHLARLLVQQPDLLMLDEPTNHLDLEALCWFQEYLRDYKGAILLISHDRDFLNALIGTIYEIRQRKLRCYRGNYDAYVVQRDAQEEQLLSAYKNQQKVIQKLQTFADRFKAKATKAAQAQAKLKQIERMDVIEEPERVAKGIKIRFPQPARSGRVVVRLTNVRQAYGDTVVYNDLNMEVERGQRMVLVGPNGAGKSTLNKILAGVLPIQAGVRELGLHVKVGYYAQYRVDMLDQQRTILEEAMSMARPPPEEFIRTVLGSFLFTGDDVFKRVSVLSGGEKSRLALVKLLLDPPNVLLMDEPTTHLDMASIEALISALENYEGTLVFISHDVYFIRKLARLVLHVSSGKLHLYHGDYQYYLEKSGATSARAALSSDAKPAATRAAQAPNRPSVLAKEQKRNEAEARNAKFQERRTLQKAVSTLEKEIARLEAQQVAQTAALENPETYKDAGRAISLNHDLTHTVAELARANARWEEAATRLGQAE